MLHQYMYFDATYTKEYFGIYCKWRAAVEIGLNFVYTHTKMTHFAVIKKE